MSNVDRAATNERYFLDRKSKVMLDGREILGKKDWDIRKRELWERAGGRCEYFEPIGEEGRKIMEMAKLGPVIAHPSYFHRCDKEGVIPAHIIPRKDITQRDDRLSNLKLYCLEHDRLMERQSWRRTRFGEREASHEAL